MKPAEKTPPVSGDAGKAAYALVIHGGAGVIRKENMSPEKEAAYTASLTAALKIGEEMLASGADALDVVEAVVKFLEDDSLFNAGKGAVLTADGHAELDASIMDGKTGMAGAVAGVKTVKHPIAAARKVMEASDHVMLSGAGADAFAGLQGLEIVPNDYFITEARKQQLEKEKAGIVQDGASNVIKKFGTVGAVALDREGHLAAATSTGGMTNKKYGRIGDSPIIGAGTYAADGIGAVSCTGHGEYFIREAVAYDLIARMKYGKQSIQVASDSIIFTELPKIGGTGGFIAMDAHGQIVMPFNTDGMFRGSVKAGEAPKVLIYQD